ncbi:hypothetical protein BJ508DRAFT_330283 [Ascobolus immersus RN42]|uniref:Cora-domain-containing protein n=1 Tax=Ascobolus immersus RN42 TaxID=1160509 RepID=A0A3N4HTY6_ASCIM|nr:hypothetical protein BJ508DRAFT_330283 [Ascobolus immersus RN42]
MDRYAYDQALAELTFARDTQLLYYDSTIADSGRTWHSEDEVKVLLQTLVSESMKRHSLPVSPGGSPMERGGYGTGRSTPLSIGANVFDDIINTLSFPKRFVQGMNTSSGSLGRYLEYEERNGHHVPRFLNLFFQTPSSSGKPLAFTLRHDPLHPLTLVFLFTSDPSDLHTLLSHLRHLDLPLRTNPQGFLNLILEQYSLTCEDQRREMENMLFKTEHKIPTVPCVPYERHLEPGPAREANLRSVESLSSAMSGLESLVCFEGLATDFMIESFDALKDLNKGSFPLASPPLPGPHSHAAMKKHFESSMANPTTQLLKDDLGFLKTSATLRMQAVDRLKRRLATHLQFLKPGGLRYGSSSELEAISLAARKCEDALKMICWVIMTCLPGLLVATILGSGIFILPEYGEGGGGTLKNVGLTKLFPVFWAVSVPITLLVAISWILWSGRRTKKYEGLAREGSPVNSSRGGIRKVNREAF